MDQAIKIVDLFVNSNDTILFTKGRIRGSSKYEKAHSYLNVITINKVEEGVSPKKYALSQAVSIAKGEVSGTVQSMGAATKGGKYHWSGTGNSKW